jgi:dihydrofolate reductase
MKLTATTWCTLDGVMQGPGGVEEDPSGGFAHGGWLVPFADADVGRLITEIFERADAFLIGRITYDLFFSHWPHVTDPDDIVAAKLNRLPKYVVSSTLTDPEWDGTHVVAPDDLAAAVARLKAQDGNELQVHGSSTLLQALNEQRLIDAYTVWTFPVVLGEGKRLFGDGAVPTGMSHVRTDVTSTGVVVSTYEAKGAPKTGTVVREEGRTLTQMGDEVVDPWNAGQPQP